MSARQYAKQDREKDINRRMRLGLCLFCGEGPWPTVGEKERHQNDECKLAPLHGVWEGRRRAS